MHDVYWIVISTFVCFVIPCSMIAFAIGLYIGTGYRNLLKPTPPTEGSEGK